MSATTFRYLVLAASLCSACALANVGPTSAGVVPTGAVPNTDPSAAVQQQSAGFVQQNQQAAANGSTPQGTSTTVTAITGPTASGANAPAGNAKNDPAAAAAGTPAAAPAAPPTPPAPPPNYVSNVKRVAPDGTTTPATTVAVVPAPPAVAAAPDQSHPELSAAAVTPAAAPNPAVATPPAVQTTPAKPVANNAAPAAAKPAPAIKKANEPVTGGSGTAPDGYTFYLGFGIALALLLFALFTYLRTQQSDIARRSPG